MRLANALKDYYQVHFSITYYQRSTYQSSISNLHQEISVHKGGNSVLFYLVNRYSFLMKLLHVLKLLKWYFSYQERNAFSSLKKYLSRHSISVAHSHSPQATRILAALKEQFSFKLFTTLHGVYEVFQKAWTEQKFSTFINTHLLQLDHVIYLTNEQKNTFLKFNYPEDKMTRIYNGIDVKSTDNRTKFDGQRALKIIIVSRAIKEKGWEEAILASVNLNKNSTVVNLSLVGDGNLLNTLREKYDHYEWLEFCGHSDDVLSIISTADIGMLPSYFSGESLPNSISEYLSQSKPVIASDIGAVHEMIDTEKGQCGILIESAKGEKIDVSKIESAIEQYLKNPENVEQHSDLAATAFEKFRMSRCVEEHKKIYDHQ